MPTGSAPRWLERRIHSGLVTLNCKGDFSDRELNHFLQAANDVNFMRSQGHVALLGGRLWRHRPQVGIGGQSVL